MARLLYMQDYGGPIGFRLISRNPEILEWMILQNTNAYEVGLTEARAGLRNVYWLDRNAQNEAAVEGLLTRWSANNHAPAGPAATSIVASGPGANGVSSAASRSA